MTVFEIYVEGHQATGSSSTAQLITTQEAPSFREACIRAHQRGAFKGYGEFNPEKLTLWGCRLFDNRTDAQKSFG